VRQAEHPFVIYEDQYAQDNEEDDVYAAGERRLRRLRSVQPDVQEETLLAELFAGENCYAAGDG
jgi:hypothetical protein